jgi:hypothetical protein
VKKKNLEREAAASGAGGRCTSGGGGGKSSRPLTALWSRVPSPASDRAPLLPLAASRAPAPPPRAALPSRPAGLAPLPGPDGRADCPEEAGRGRLGRPAGGQRCRTSARPPTARGRARSQTWPSSGSRGTRPGKRGVAPAAGPTALCALLASGRGAAGDLRARASAGARRPGHHPTRHAAFLGRFAVWPRASRFPFWASLAVKEGLGGPCPLPLPPFCPRTVFLLGVGPPSLISSQVTVTVAFGLVAAVFEFTL